MHEAALFALHRGVVVGAMVSILYCDPYGQYYEFLGKIVHKNRRFYFFLCFRTLCSLKKYVTFNICFDVYE